MPSCVSQALWSLWRCAFLTPNPDKAAFCLGGAVPKAQRSPAAAAKASLEFR